MASVLRWGILGPGRIAPRLVRGIGATPRASLVAVASRDARRAQAFAGSQRIPRAHGSYEALLADPEVDVVYVALPNHLHAPWTIRALEAGKHVLCEKPLALAPEEVDAIADASRRAGRIAVEAFMYLHHPQILRAVEMAHDGSLGQLELVSGSFSFPLAQPGDPRVDRAMGGGSLWDVGCYPVSLARRIAGGDPDGVTGFARFDANGVDWSFVGQLHFPSGLLATFDSGFAEPDRQHAEIVGQTAALRLDWPWLPEPDGPPPSASIWRGTEAVPVQVPSVDQYAAEVEDLTSAIVDGTKPRIDLAFSRGGIATLSRLDRDARERAAPRT